MMLAYLSPSAAQTAGGSSSYSGYSESDWTHYLGDRSSSQYSRLQQVDRENVSQLEVAWTYNSSAGAVGGFSSMPCNPIIVDGVLYGLSADSYFFAVDAASGEEKWRFDPFADTGGRRRGRNRGLAYWTDGKEARLLVAISRSIYALDPVSGALIKSFGQDGVVDFRVGLGEDLETVNASSGTPGVLYKDLYILGSRVSENYGAAPGDIRAFNVRTGELVWTFHTIPHPGELGYETWPKDAWQRVGGANAWAGLSLDEERGMVFVPTGSAAYDFNGADRHGANLFANSIVALDAATGKYIWHFQTVHHDIWDRDLSLPANLVTIQRNGEKVDAVAQVSKSGLIFVLDRETGKPIFPVEEVPVPASEIEGEKAYPTQPIPTKPPPLTRVFMSEDEITDISPAAHAYVAENMKKMKLGEMYTPPSIQPTLYTPMFFGGAEWGGAGYDPASGTLYINANEIPCELTLVKLDAGENLTEFQQGRNAYAQYCSSCHGGDLKGGTHMGASPPLLGIGERMTKLGLEKMIVEGRGRMEGFPWLPQYRPARFKALTAYLLGTATGADAADKDSGESIYNHTGYNRFEDAEGYPAIKPPWGTLSAVDLNEGTIKWQVPLGEYEELTKRGIAPTGTQNFGGPAVTAGGLVFIAASADEKIRAFDQETGEILWQADLPASGFATPSIYSVDGRQYIVIACGGGKVKRPAGASYVAFALPEK
ncbi:MAG: quinoprotein glucose dehydrogenase [Candidatus Latescibacterota bacterium]|jgi:quinoprotein glucose dehydrogenase